MLSGDVLELTLFQRLFDEVEVRNVLHYSVSTVGALDEVGLVTAFSNHVLPIVTLIQTDALVHYKMGVVNLTDGVGFSDSDLVPDVPGGIAGSDAPPFQAYAFRKLRTDRSTRTGQLRVSGVPKAASDDGRLVSTFVSIVTACAGALSVSIDDNTGGTYQPVIVGKNTDGTVRAVNLVAGVEYASISTQNTRKYGRGN